VSISEVPDVHPPRRLRRRSLAGGRKLSDGTVLYWWAEITFILVFYVVYSAIRNSNQGSPSTARKHAYQLIEWQQTLGINHEHALHRWALEIRPLIIASNYFYGSLHFVVTGGVMIFLYRKFSDDYPLWRNAIAIATAIALIGFAFWPLMPPRLLPHHFGYIDTLDKYPTFWSFKRGAVSKISNQYAAMPSVHCAWALACACALVPRLEHTWAKVLAVLYPVGTVITIVLTANHYFLDAVGGFIALGIGFLIARTFTRAGRRTPTGSEPTSLPPPDPVAV
jgi:membrane-associated phospholipid phosphatase